MTKYFSSQIIPPSPPTRPQHLSHDWDNLRGAILLVGGDVIEVDATAVVHQIRITMIAASNKS